jgi:hypothetical protein
MVVLKERLLSELSKRYYDLMNEGKYLIMEQLRLWDAKPELSSFKA